MDRGRSAALIRYELTLTLGTGWHADLTLDLSGDGDWLWRSKPAGPSPATLGSSLERLRRSRPSSPRPRPWPPPAAMRSWALPAELAEALARSSAVSTRSVVLHGAELAIHDPDSPTPEAFLLFDLETELDLTTGLLSTTRPIKVRHKAIGLRLDFGTTGSSPKLTRSSTPARDSRSTSATPAFSRCLGSSATSSSRRVRGSRARTRPAWTSISR